MFFRLFFIFATLAVAFASPKPDPQLLTYGAAPYAPVAYSGYGAAPVAYATGYGAYPYAAYPYAYSNYFVR